MIMFWATIANFLIASLGIAAQLVAFSTLIHTALVANVGLPLGEIRNLTNIKVANPEIVLQWATQLMVCLRLSFVY